MTSISATSATQYQSPYLSILVPSSDADPSASSAPNVASKKTAAASTEDDEQSLSSAAEQLVAHLVNLLLNLQAAQSEDGDQSASDEDNPYVRIVAGMDIDGDGSITQAEFIAARPSDVGEDEASRLFERFDRDDAGSLTIDQLAEAMKSARPPHGSKPPGQDDASVAFNSMDTDGDGVVTEAEFLASRPDDVTEEQAAALFEVFDTEDTGSVTQEQFLSTLEPRNSPLLAGFALPDMAYSGFDFDDDTSIELGRI